MTGLPERSAVPYGGRDLDRLARHPFEVLIIGGGINGAGLARDLALRGRSVLLVDKGDFASGTSSASTKLVHGGLRYLENFDFGLVFEACRERAVLQQIAPHLVRPLPFLIPVYRDDPRPLWMIRAGLTLYDLLAMFHNPGRHKILSASRALARAPVLQPEGLAGVARYWDCRMDDARLVLENILAAREAGAMTENYLEATILLYGDGRVSGARLLDRESQRTVEVQARCVVNAAGPWLDRVRGLDGAREALLRPTRGTHILVPRIGSCEEALYLTAGSDKRMFFVIPWGELSLIGTTDIDFPESPDRVAPTAEDIDYLLAECRRHLRGVAPGRGDVLAAFAGLRPLVAEESDSASKVSREHRIVVSPSGLVSVGGGKYTTYRAVAEELADLAEGRLGGGRNLCRTAQLPLPGAGAAEGSLGYSRHWKVLRGQHGLSAEALQRLTELYGTRTRRLLALLEDDPALAEPVCAGSSLLRVQVVYGVYEELARTPEDILRRRVPLALAAGRGLAELTAVCAELAQLLGADAGVSAAWQSDYRRRTDLPENLSTQQGDDA